MPSRHSEIWLASIGIGDLPGLAQWDCEQVAILAFAQYKPVNEVRHCLGSGSGPEGGPGGFKVLGPVVTQHVDGTKTMTISFELASLRKAGFTGSSYGYSVLLAESQDKQDEAPNRRSGGPPITHELSPPPTPTPVPATSTPEPTVAPTLAPTPTPTPTPIPTSTAEPTDVGFAAPEDTIDDTGGVPVGVIAAASSIGLAGIGVAAFRFWPF